MVLHVCTLGEGADRETKKVGISVYIYRTIEGKTAEATAS